MRYLGSLGNIKQENFGFEDKNRSRSYDISWIVSATNFTRQIA
jgi:hypothetical protein